MSRVSSLWITLLSTLLLCACAARRICPAFQSYYIHDKALLEERFSYFTPDTVPKMLTASKSKYLIITPKPYRKREKDLQTVEMKTIYPSLDSLQEAYGLHLDSLRVLAGVEPLSDSLQVADSLAAAPTPAPDSIYMITLEREKFNIDQDAYMWYFRKILLLPDVRILLGIGEDYKRNKKEKKEGSFFEWLFGKKGKRKARKDSLAAIEADPARVEEDRGVDQATPNGESWDDGLLPLDDQLTNGAQTPLNKEEEPEAATARAKPKREKKKRNAEQLEEEPEPPPAGEQDSATDTGGW